MAIDLLSWIDETNPTQTKWAINYLVKRQLIAVPSRRLGDPGLLHWAEEYLNHQSGLNDENLTTLRSDMMNAWRSHSRRKEDRLVAINLRVEKEVRDDFRKLAYQKGMTQPKLISDLVRRSSRLESDAQQALKEKKQELENKRHQLPNTRQMARKDREIKQLKGEIDLLWRRISRLSHELCEAEALQDLNIPDSGDLPPEQQEQVDQRAKKLAAALMATHRRKTDNHTSGPYENAAPSDHSEGSATASEPVNRETQPQTDTQSTDDITTNQTPDSSATSPSDTDNEDSHPPLDTQDSPSHTQSNRTPKILTITKKVKSYKIKNMPTK